MTVIKFTHFLFPNTYYSSRLLSPQHRTQVRMKGIDAYHITYHDAIIMRWSKNKYQIIALLDNRKHRIVGVMRSSKGIKAFIS
jgi:hypothetical protein